MSDIALPGSIEPARERGPKLDHASNPLQLILFFGALAAGVLFVAYSIYTDIDATGIKISNYLPFLLLFVALMIALGFEFVNGFHDTANAVATVIYTHSLPANIAVVWSGTWNLLGVLWSSGAVAFGIVSLLPVELILQVGSSAGFAMVFALLIAAMSRANTIAKPALLPTWRMSSTGSSEMIPNATAPVDIKTPRKLKAPDHTTATVGVNEWV